MDNKDATIISDELTIDPSEIKQEPEDNPVIFLSEVIPSKADLGKTISLARNSPVPKTILVLNRNGETISTESVISSRIIDQNTNIKAKPVVQSPLLSILNRSTSSSTVPIISYSNSRLPRNIDQSFLTFTSRCIEADGTVKTLKEYLCNFCQYKISVINEMEKHVLTHKFVCNHCSFTSLTRIEIIKHKHDCHVSVSSEELAGYEGLDNLLANKSTELVSSSLPKSSLIPNSSRSQYLSVNPRTSFKIGPSIERNIIPEDGNFFTYKLVQDGSGRIKMYECYICGLRCNTTRDIIKHASTHSSTELAKFGKKGTSELDVKWECYYCSHCDAAQGEVINHIIKTHPNQRIQLKMINNKISEVTDSSLCATSSKLLIKPSTSTFDDDENLNTDIDITSIDTVTSHIDKIISENKIKMSKDSGTIKLVSIGNKVSEPNINKKSNSSNCDNSESMAESLVVMNKFKSPEASINVYKWLDKEKDASKLINTKHKVASITNILSLKRQNEEIMGKKNLNETKTGCSSIKRGELEVSGENTIGEKNSENKLVLTRGGASRIQSLQVAVNSKETNKDNAIDDKLKSINLDTNRNLIDKLNTRANLSADTTINKCTMPDMGENKEVNTVVVKKVTSTEGEEEEECLWGCFYCSEQSGHRSKIVSHLKKMHREEKLVVTRRKITRVPASEMKKVSGESKVEDRCKDGVENGLKISDQEKIIDNDGSSLIDQRVNLNFNTDENESVPSREIKLRDKVGRAGNDLRKAPDALDKSTPIKNRGCKSINRGQSEIPSSNLDEIVGENNTDSCQNSNLSSTNEEKQPLNRKRKYTLKKANKVISPKKKKVPTATLR